MERKLADLWEHLSEDGTVELRSTTVVEDGTIPKGSRLTVRRRETMARGDAEFMIVCEIPMYAEERSEWWREPVFLGPEALGSGGDEAEPAQSEATDRESDPEPGWSSQAPATQGTESGEWTQEESPATTVPDGAEPEEEPGWTDAEIERMAQGADATSDDIERDEGAPEQRVPPAGAEETAHPDARVGTEPTPPTSGATTPDTGWDGDRSAPFDDDMDF